MPFLGLAPDRPLGALPIETMSVTVTALATIEAIDVNPLAALVQDPKKRLVVSVEIVNLPLGA